MVFFEFVQSLDDMILEFFRNNICSSSLDGLMKMFTYLAEHGLFVMILAVVLLCFKRTRKAGITLACSMVVMVLFNNFIIKPIVARPRPFIADPTLKDLLIVSPPSGYSFPSGHTAIAFTSVTALTKYNKWVAFAYIAAVMVGVSRIYLQVHYPSDVLCGALLGVVYGITGIILSSILFKVYKKYFEEKVETFIQSKFHKK